MRRFALFLSVLISIPSFAQTSTSEAPATREDIQRYMEIINNRDMIQKFAANWTQVLHQKVHEEYLKSKDKLPPDFEQRMDQEVDQAMKSMPWDTIFEATIPVYQKHFTKADMDAFIAFYSTPSGQKLLRETPAILSETLQAIMPIAQAQMNAVLRRIHQSANEKRKEVVVPMVPVPSVTEIR